MQETRFTGRAVGWLAYDPRVASIPFKPWWVILRCDPDWYRMYARWAHMSGPGAWKRIIDADRVDVITRSKLDLTPRLALVKSFNVPAWGPHISITRGEKPRKNQQAWGKHLTGRQIEFQYDPNVRWNDEYWWLDVQCDALLDLREFFGLPRTPRMNLHLTVCRNQ